MRFHSNRRGLQSDPLEEVFADLQQEVRGRPQRSFPFAYPIGMVCLLAASYFIKSEPQVKDRASSTLMKTDALPESLQGQIRGTLSSSVSQSTSSLQTNDGTIKQEATISTQFQSDPNRSFRILSLGGSTTWGAKIESRSDAFPFVLARKLGPNWSTTNLAVRATGASYASQCIESMIKEGTSAEDLAKDYDVILLEYSLNGLEGMPLLLDRLRRRYPNTVLIYVHLWSLRMLVHNALTDEKPRLVLNQGHNFADADESIYKMLSDPHAQWEWSDNMLGDSKQVSMDALDATARLHGFIYELPLPRVPTMVMEEGWFGRDFHHLSAKGHEIVASGIHSLLQQPNIFQPPPTPTDLKFSDHGWGKGDQCYTWFETGVSPHVSMTGGAMQMFVTPDKWAFHVGGPQWPQASLEFLNASPEPQPLALVIMSWGNPSIYPKSAITIQPADDTKTHSMILDPLYPTVAKRMYHITNTVHVGWAESGKNVLQIAPTESTETPLRVTGIVMCGACLEMDVSYLTGDGDGILNVDTGADDAVSTDQSIPSVS